MWRMLYRGNGGGVDGGEDFPTTERLSGRGLMKFIWRAGKGVESMERRSMVGQ
jgi:hypothetical protein